MQRTFEVTAVREQFPATVAFRIEGHTLREITEYMAQQGYFVADGHFYASTLARKLGIYDRGSCVRAGLAPYNTAQESKGLSRRWSGSFKDRRIGLIELAPTYGSPDSPLSSLVV